MNDITHLNGSLKLAIYRVKQKRTRYIDLHKLSSDWHVSCAFISTTDTAMSALYMDEKHCENTGIIVEQAYKWTKLRLISARTW